MTARPEISIVPIAAISDGNPSLRLDAEFFQRRNLDAKATVERQRFELLEILSPRIQHPVEVEREYSDRGLDTLMAANVRQNRVDLLSLPRMDASMRERVARNRLAQGDVLLVRTGANFGTVAPWKSDGEVYACADLLVVRNPSAPAGYVSSFLASAYGHPLVKRCSYGSAQPHISPTYIGLIPVPRFPRLESQVDEFVGEAVRLEEEALRLFREADSSFLEAVGLEEWCAQNPLTYSRSLAEVVSAERLDAQHFSPNWDELKGAISSRFPMARLGDFAVVNRRGVQPEYVDQGDLPVVASQSVIPSGIDVDELPFCDSTMLSEATLKRARVQAGDVLIYTTGAYIGRAAPYLSPRRSVASNHVNILRQARFDPVFLCVAINSVFGRTQVHKYQRGSAQAELYPSDIASIEVPEVNEDVQRNIRRRFDEAQNIRGRSKKLLSDAVRSIEIALEVNESAAAAYIADRSDEVGNVEIGHRSESHDRVGRVRSA